MIEHEYDHYFLGNVEVEVKSILKKSNEHIAENKEEKITKGMTLKRAREVRAEGADMIASRGDRRAIGERSSANSVLNETSGRVSFHPLVRIRSVQPYSEVYGLHPRLFNFDQYGNKIEKCMNVDSLNQEVVVGRSPGGGVRMHARHNTDRDDTGRADAEAERPRLARLTRACRGSRHLSSSVACAVESH